MIMTNASAQSTSLLHAVQDIAVIIAQQQEKPLLLTRTLERLAVACGAPYAIVFLHDSVEGEATELAPAAAYGADANPLLALTEEVRRAIHGDAQAEVTLVERALGDVHAYALVPLHRAGIVQGAIICGFGSVEIDQSEAQLLQAAACMLSGALHEIDLQARLDTAQTILESQRARLEQTSSIDPLTGLLNRQSFTDKIAPAVAKAQQGDSQLSLLMIDTDHLRVLNDRFGAQAGDEALRRIAEVVQGGIRGWDVAARFSGDEFAVLLPSTGGIGAVAVAERLRDQISALTFGPAGHTVSLTATIGVACLSSAVTNADELLVKADQCLLEGKTFGGNQVIIDWDQALEGVDEV